MRKLHLGQAMDIQWHRDVASLPGMDEYLAMCRLKTGCLARLAAVLGAAAAGPELEAEGERLGRGAEDLGLGFQILDDVKNLDTGNPGKQRGDDVVEGKKSLPVLLYLHRKPERRDFVLRCFSAARTGGPGVPEVEELAGALKTEGLLEEAASRGHRLIREGSECLGAVRVPGVSFHEEGRHLLADFAEFIV
jgi:octaprenyl-diphosphate synthase